MPLSNEPAYLTGLIRRGSRACDRHGTLFLCFKLRRINRLGIQVKRRRYLRVARKLLIVFTSLPRLTRKVARLTGQAREEWEHGIAPVTSLRYSVMFRTLAPGTFKLLAAS